MRDIALLCFFLGCIPFMITRPWMCVIMWVWLSVMNPHRLAFGFAYDLPLAAATVAVAIVSFFVTKDERRLPITAPVVALALFTLWMCITSLFPFHTGSGYDMWSRVMKIMFMTFVAMTVIHSKKHIHWMIWTIVFSLAFYGAKGGLFTVLNGGTYLVWGPASSFIEGNNEVALAFVMTIPLMRYVQLGLKKKWLRWGMTAVMALTAIAAIGSHSRGALVALAAMASMMWWKSRNKAVMGVALVLSAIAMVMFMPSEWLERMNTIKTYDEDASALGRINAWWMAFNLAKDRIVGGGFDIYDFDVFGKYAPNPIDVHAAHSIYFQVMAEHGFIGVFLFMSIGAFTWIAASEAKRKAKGIADLAWVGPMMDMMKVSMVGYGVGGAFLSLAYFDVPYYVTVIVVATRTLVLSAQKARAPDRNSDRLEKRNRFGGVVIDDEPADLPSRVTRPRGNDWRGQGAFAMHSPPRF